MHSLIRTASTLQTKLIKMATEDFQRGAGGESASKELCYFLASLMHNQLLVLQLPTLQIPQCQKQKNTGLLDFCKHLLGSFLPPKSSIETLMEAIGAKCSRLQYLHIKTLETGPLLTRGSHLGNSFFRALPQLRSLKNVTIDSMCCDDWALRQIGMHGYNLA